MQYDIFISHSREDKETIARTLADALQARGLKVWLDDEQLLQVGGSIQSSIDSGMSHSRFGAVILSPDYLESEWAPEELDAFFIKEKEGSKRIFPILHTISREGIESFSPLLADKLAFTTEADIESLAEDIHVSIQQQTPNSLQAARDQDKKYGWPNNNWQLGMSIVFAVAAIVSLFYAVVHQEDLANEYVTLGTFYETCGEPDKAEEYQLKALEINKGLGRQEDLADNYSNLGNIYRITIDLDKSEAYFLNAAKINETLGRQREVANNYASLGIVYEARAELDKSEAYLFKALKVNKALDRQESIAGNYSNLGVLYEAQGDLDKAEAYYLKALEIDEDLDHQEGMVTNYGNLVFLYKIRGEQDKVEDYLLKAKEVHETLSF